MPNFRIVSQETHVEQGTAVQGVDTIWRGSSFPGGNVIQESAANLLARRSREPRDSFKQHENDYILIQRQRSARVFGWKTLQSINVFDCVQ